MLVTPTSMWGCPQEKNLKFDSDLVSNDKERFYHLSHRLGVPSAEIGDSQSFEAAPLVIQMYILNYDHSPYTANGSTLNRK